VNAIFRTSPCGVIDIKMQFRAMRDIRFTFSYSDPNFVRRALCSIR